MMNQKQPDWANLFKVKLSNILDSSMDKHDIVKLLLVRKLLKKHQKRKMYLRIYTEFPITEGKVCDVYMEDLKNKAYYAWEIQKDVSETWIEETKKIYSNWNPIFAKTTDFFVIDLNKINNDINKMSEELNEYVI